MDFEGMLTDEARAILGDEKASEVQYFIREHAEMLHNDLAAFRDECRNIYHEITMSDPEHEETRKIESGCSPTLADDGPGAE